MFFGVMSSHAKDPSDNTLVILRQPPTRALTAYKTYVEKYARKTVVGDVEQRDRDEQWAIFSRYAKAMWDVYDCLEEGDLIFKFPGLLSHGSIRWNDEKKRYSISIGFHPFSPGDGLGDAAVFFDINGKVLAKNKAKYPW